MYFFPRSDTGSNFKGDLWVLVNFWMTSLASTIAAV
jgi:hypothetical protein